MLMPDSTCMHVHQLIQFTPASGFHLTVVFLSLVQNSMELLPVISPTPNLLSFHPPKENGSLGTGTPTFTPIIPALAFSIIYLAIPPFCVNTEAAFPYGLEFSIASASSTVLVRIMEITGPKIS